MIVIEDSPRFHIMLRDTENFVGRKVKFVKIMDLFYAVSLIDLCKSDEFINAEQGPINITRELLESFPPPGKSLGFVTSKLLDTLPVVMFERPDIDGLYFRFDGRHRCIGAAKLGRKFVNAVWIPRKIWGKYIIGYQPADPAQEPQPLCWKRSPGAPIDGPGEHLEPNFTRPED